MKAWEAPGLSPEERAELIQPTEPSDPMYGQQTREEIAAAIRAAVAEEREACAKVAENAALNFPVGCGHAQDIAAGIINLIRERSA